MKRNKKFSLESVIKTVRDIYGNKGMFRYKKDAEGNITTCSIGKVDEDGTNYLVKGKSEKGDWKACIDQALVLEGKIECVEVVAI